MANWEVVPAPDEVFIDIDGISFFLGTHRFFMSREDANKFGLGLVSAVKRAEEFECPTQQR